jgi:hypothetical protein
MSGSTVILAVIPPGMTSNMGRHQADETGDVTSQDDL